MLKAICVSVPSLWLRLSTWALFAVIIPLELISPEAVIFVPTVHPKFVPKCVSVESTEIWPFACAPSAKNLLAMISPLELILPEAVICVIEIW